MPKCEICNKNEAVKLISQVPVCADCIGNLRKACKGDSDARGYLADRSNFPEASTSAVDLIDKALKAPVKKQEAQPPQAQAPTSKKRVPILAIISIVMAVVMIGEAVAIGFLMVQLNKQNAAIQAQADFTATLQELVNKQSSSSEKPDPTPNPTTVPTSVPTPVSKQENNGDADFRSVKFGDSPEEVIEKETAERINVPTEDDKSLTYSDQWQYMNCIILYEFNDDNQLYRAGYFCDEKYRNYITYVSNFNTIIEKLTEKYGEPTYKNIYTSPLYEYDGDDGQALQLGHLSEYYEFETDDMTIIANLKNDNDLTFAVGYESKLITHEEPDEL